jgi:tetratricopeptide (TPR) repeat protein
VKKWVITLAVAVCLLAMVVSIRWWLPPLVAFAVHDKEKAESLKTLLELIALPVGWLITVGTFIYGLWQKKKDDAAKAGAAVTARHIDAGRDAVAAGGNVQTGGVSVGGPGTTSVSGPVAAHDAVTYNAPVYYGAPRTTAPAFSTPHQLPPPPADFTGREEEVKELLAAVVNSGVTISGLQGQGGVGKTSLALKLAEKLAPSFPDGQIYLDLLGVSQKPVTTYEAMGYVIRSFEGAEATLPEQEQELAGKYRSVLDRKRALLLMDNAKDAPQIRPLIPPAGCVLLVTSRFHFLVPGLQARNLDTLPFEKAEELLLKIAPRIDGESEALAKLCGYLPQALRLAATTLAERVNMAPSDYRQRLAEERNRPKLLAAGNESVEASISLGYGLLDAEAQKRWRMLGVFPEAFDGAAAATVWSAEKNPAEDTLGLLTQYSMLEWNEKTRRYRLHDLIRDFAQQNLSDEERYEASLRHARHYLEVLRHADDLYLKGGASVLSGLGLFDLERTNIEAGQGWAANLGKDDEAAAEVCNLYPDAGVYCLDLRHHPRERIRWLEAGLDAARHLKHKSAEGVHLGNLGSAYRNLGGYRRAIEYYEKHLEIARAIGDRQGEAQALGNLGIAYNSLGEYRRAIEYNEKALEIAREIGDRQSEGQALGSLGNAYSSLGEYRRAIEYHEKTLEIAREIGDRQTEGNALGSLGNAYSSLGEYRRAIESHEMHLEIAREIGDRRGEGNALGNLGNGYNSLGECRRAIEYYGKQLEIVREIGDRHGENTALWNLSLALDAIGERKRAIEYAEASLKIHEEIEDPFAPTVRKQLEEWRRE